MAENKQLCLYSDPIWYRQTALSISTEMHGSSTINLTNIACLCRWKLRIEHRNNGVIPLLRCKLEVRWQIIAREKTKGREYRIIETYCYYLPKSLYFKTREISQKRTEGVLGITFSLTALCGKHFWKIPVCTIWIETISQLTISNVPKEGQKNFK